MSKHITSRAFNYAKKHYPNNAKRMRDIEIGQQITEKVDDNSEFALLFNLIASNIDSFPDGDAKTEMVAYLEKRKAIKDSVKEEYPL